MSAPQTAYAKRKARERADAEWRAAQQAFDHERANRLAALDAADPFWRLRRTLRLTGGGGTELYLAWKAAQLARTR